MKKSIVAIISFLILVSVPLLAVVPVAEAATCNGVETSIDFQCNQYSTDGISAILMYVINFMAIGVGIAVVIGIIFGGITYAQSDGEASKAKEGQGMITNSVVGLFLFIFLYAGANFLIPGGAFNLNAKVVSTPSTTGSSTPGGSSGTSSKTLPTLSKVSNFRDAGDSGYIKTGVLLRSANLNDASKNDKSALASYLAGGLIIDLRKTDDNGYEKDPALSGVGNRLYSIEGESSSAGYRDTFVKSKSAREQFGNAITAIANADGPVLVHCKAGKDRTGWTVALVMMAVGATKTQALAEYKKSPDIDQSWFNAAYKEAVKKSHSSDGTILGYITQSVDKGGLGVSESTIAALKDKLKK